MIKTKIEFQSTWSRPRAQNFLERLLSDEDVSEIGMSMVITDEPEAATHNDSDRVEEYIQKLQEIEPDKINEDPDIFTEIEPIPGEDLGPAMGTAKPIITYAKTKDNRLAIYYNETATYTTMEIIRALPAKIPASMLLNMHSGKRAAIRGFKAWLTEEEANHPLHAIGGKAMYDTGLDPYEPTLTGGSKTDTHAHGKVEGDLE